MLGLASPRGVPRRQGRGSPGGWTGGSGTTQSCEQFPSVSQRNSSIPNGKLPMVSPLHDLTIKEKGTAGPRHKRWSAGTQERARGRRVQSAVLPGRPFPSARRTLLHRLLPCSSRCSRSGAQCPGNGLRIPFPCGHVVPAPPFQLAPVLRKAKCGWGGGSGNPWCGSLCPAPCWCDPEGTAVRELPRGCWGRWRQRQHSGSAGRSGAPVKSTGRGRLRLQPVPLMLPLPCHQIWNFQTLRKPPAMMPRR